MTTIAIGGLPQQPAKQIQQAENTNEIEKLCIENDKKEEFNENNVVAENNDLKTELTLENFKESIEKETGLPLNSRKNKKIIHERFMLIVKKMPDNEKVGKIGLVLEITSSCPELLEFFFNSFEDKKLKQQCADSVNYEKFKDLDSCVQKELVKYRSIPGTKILSEENEKKSEEIYRKYPTRIEELFRPGITEEERNKEIEAITDSDEKQAILDFCKCHEIRACIAEDAVTNTDKYDNNPKAAENIIEDINNAAKKQPGYEAFLQRMAKIISKTPESDSVIDKNKLTELLNKTSEGKFSEIIQKLDKKNAVDESGNFKTTSAEVIAKSEEKIQTITQSIEEASKPELIVVETKSSKAETNNIPDTGIVSYETITGDDGVELVKDILLGKVNVSEFFIKLAIKQYKQEDSATQKDILFDASGSNSKYFNELVANTKTAILEKFTGRSFDKTKKVKNEVEERKNDVEERKNDVA